MKQPAERPIRICFVAPKAFSVLSGDTSVRHIGGAEVQQSLIARGLQERGYDVRFVVLDHGQPDGVDLNGIRAFHAYAPEAGLPRVRFLHPRLTGLWSAMKRADADVYYQRTSDSLTGIVAAFARTHRRRFVFSLGSAGDCDPALPFCSSLSERVPYRYGLRHADAVVAQTVSQQEQLLACFGIASTVIPSCIAPPTDARRVEPPAPGSRPRMMWAGRFSTEKRLEWLLELAERCPEIDFDVIGDGLDGQYARGLRERAGGIENVRLLGYVPHREMSKHYAAATALICTSPSEGFPNVFLEAWARGLPVVSTFDPDGIIARFELGLAASQLDKLAAAVRKAASDRAWWLRVSDSAHRYFLEHHTVGAVCDAYGRLLDALCRDESMRRRCAPVVAG